MVKNESKKDAFRRLVTQRTIAVLDRIRILGKCSNSRLYEYTDEDVRKIFRTIESELRTIKLKFTNSKKPTFKL